MTVGAPLLIRSTFRKSSRFLEKGKLIAIMTGKQNRFTENSSACAPEALLEVAVKKSSEPRFSHQHQQAPPFAKRKCWNAPVLLVSEWPTRPQHPPPHKNASQGKSSPVQGQTAIPVMTESSSSFVRGPRRDQCHATASIAPACDRCRAATTAVCAVLLIYLITADVVWLTGRLLSGTRSRRIQKYPSAFETDGAER